MHKVTAPSIARHKVPSLPENGSTIKSTLAVIYCVTKYGHETPYQLFLQVEIDESNLGSMAPNQSVEIGGMSESKIFSAPGW